jgi:hypothetical protein
VQRDPDITQAVAESRKAQGLPETVEDVAALAHVAAILAAVVAVEEAS